MVSITQIQALRIEISDPPGIIQIISVTTSVELPTSPTPQTAYYIIDTGIYVTTELETGASPDKYNVVELYLSDARIGVLINYYGVDKAIYKALLLISSKLASKLLIVKNSTGSESVEYIKLLDLYKYYKNIIADFKEEEKEKNLNTTGRYGTMKQPEIAGGNL